MKSIAALLIALCLCSGCSLVPFAKLKSGAKVQAPKDNGTPATIEEGSTETVLPVPAQSQVSVEPEVAATPEAPAKPAAVKITLAAPSELRSVSKASKASTGTIDTTTAIKRIEIESAANARQPLLWAAIGAAVAAVVFMVLKWPSVAMLCGIAAAVFFAAWKIAEVPWWVGLACLIAGAALMLGYKRAEWDADGDFIPDILEKKPTPASATTETKS